MLKDTAFFVLVALLVAALPVLVIALAIYNAWLALALVGVVALVSLLRFLMAGNDGSATTDIDLS